MTDTTTTDRERKCPALRICVVGHMLGRNAGHITTQGQIVADLLSSEGHSVTCVSAKLNKALRLTEMVMVLIRGHRKFDVVVLETFSGLSFVMADTVSFICRALRLPLIMVLHGGNLPTFARQHPRWLKRVLDRADMIAAPSDFMASKFREIGYRVSVIPNVVEIASYTYKQRSKILPRLLWMRSFHEIYNPAMAIRVLAAVREWQPEATLTMAGVDKGMKAEVESLAAEMGLSNAVRFAGFLDERGKDEEFSRADIYINTNRVDNMPVSVIEARASGLPVVATEVGGLPWMIRDGVDGFLVPDDDHEAMALVIKQLCEDDVLAARVSRSGREIAERSDWRRVRSDWEALFSDLLAPRRKRDVTFGTIDQQC